MYYQYILIDNLEQCEYWYSVAFISNLYTNREECEKDAVETCKEFDEDYNENANDNRFTYQIHTSEIVK